MIERRAQLVLVKICAVRPAGTDARGVSAASTGPDAPSLPARTESRSVPFSPKWHPEMKVCLAAAEGDGTRDWHYQQTTRLQLRSIERRRVCPRKVKIGNIAECARSKNFIIPDLPGFAVPSYCAMTGTITA
jgi:hypothetical protein